MPKLAFRQIRSRGVFLDQRAFRREVENVIERKSKPELIQAHERVTVNWKTDIEFKARKRINQKGISIFVFPAGENKMIWVYVTGGTKPHLIRPKGPGYPLKFQTGYKPKTAAVGKFGGPGVSTGPTVRAFKVKHPGIKARKFEETIAADYKKVFSRDIENAMRRGLRRARGR